MTRSMIPTRRVLLAAAGVALPSALVLASPARAQDDPLGPLPASWHAAEVIDLWSGQPPGGGFEPRPVPADAPPGFFRNVRRPSLHVFRPARSNGRAVLITPGGGYGFVVGTHEGAGTAEALTALGYTAFVLIYRLPDEGWRNRWDVPLQDAQRAMRIIVSSADRYGVDPKRVGVLGYSAGGHLAATLATRHAETVYPARDAIDAADARPVAAGLIYPVISLVPPHAHGGSAANLLGPAPEAGVLERRSPAGCVDATTPPTFLVHALDDGAVPVENSLMMLAALRAAAIPAEAHLFEAGGHGFGLGQAGTPASQWLQLFHLWIGRHVGDGAA